MNHESTARINHRSGYNCAQAVTVAFAEELHTTRQGPCRPLLSHARRVESAERISPGCLCFRI